MEQRSLDWTIAVVSQSADFLPNLKNALLYAEEVLWLPTSVPIVNSLIGDEAVISYAENSGMDLYDSELERFLYDVSEVRNTFIKEYDAQNEFIKQIKSDELPVRIPTAYYHPFADNILGTVAYNFIGGKRGPSSTARSLRSHWESISPDIEFHADREWGSPIEGSHVVMLDGGGDECVQLPKSWEPYEATQILLNALSAVLLPDIGHLEIADILELREQAKNELLGTRGQMLKLSSTLREMIGQSYSYETMVKEAENLIKTEVQSEVLETRKKLMDLDAKYKKGLLGKTAQFVSYVGLGMFVTSSFYEKALKIGFSMLDESLSKEGVEDLASNATQFVLKAERILK